MLNNGQRLPQKGDMEKGWLQCHKEGYIQSFELLRRQPGVLDRNPVQSNSKRTKKRKLEFIIVMS